MHWKPVSAVVGTGSVHYAVRRLIMRLRRRSTFMLVYVKAKELRFPIAVPLPIVVIEELLQAVVVICLLCTPLIRNSRVLGGLRKQADAFSLTLPDHWETYPWRIVAAIRRFVTELRRIGPVTFVDVETSDARVLIKLI
jgi:hypothetical protein